MYFNSNVPFRQRLDWKYDRGLFPFGVIKWPAVRVKIDYDLREGDWKYKNAKRFGYRSKLQQFDFAIVVRGGMRLRSE